MVGGRGCPSVFVANCLTKTRYATYIGGERKEMCLVDLVNKGT